MTSSITRREALRFSALAPFTLAALVFADKERANHVELDEEEKLPLVFSEDFDGPLNSQRWAVRDSGDFMSTGKTGPGAENWPSINRGSTAVDQAGNVEISGGTAKLWLRKAKQSQPSPYKKGWSVGETFDHTSGYLDTIGKVEVKFGRWEIRCKLPTGPKRATWGGMWLVSNKADDTYFEVDINEFFGVKEKSHKSDPKNLEIHNRAQSSIHFDSSGKDKLVKFSPMGSEKFEDEWHVWAVEVLPTTGITFYLDDEAYFNVPADQPDVVVRFAQDFKFNIRINVMTGDYWNTTDSDEKRAKPFEIDYVKVWEHNA